jgi:hypothetical protein
VTVRASRLLPALAVGGFVAALVGHLLDPHRLLAARDIDRFHLPLRTAFARLAAHGLPEWNPWVGGGQPVLSDPSYAAFYPPTWLALLSGPAWSLNLLVVLHLALTAWGAWRLARRLGARRSVAAFAAVAWSGSGPLLSLVHALNHFFGAAWLPWILLATDALVGAPDRAHARRARLALAALLALTLLNGEPVTVLVGGLAAVCWALGRATALAAVQLAPSLARLADSARSAGLSPDMALSWSLPPARWIELVAPRAFGAPERMEDGLYFGWGIHDRDFPFLLALDPGLAVLVLALGRHTPLYPLLYRHVPPFGSLRFPEKFFLLAALALALAGALGLEHLLRRREQGDRGVADFPLALAAVVVSGWIALAGLAIAGSARVADFAAAHSGIPLTSTGLDHIVAFVRTEAAVVLALALVLLVLLALARGRRTASAVLGAGFVLVLGLDLAWHHRGLLATVPAQDWLEPPPLAGELPPGARVLWSSSDFDRSLELVLRRGQAGRASITQAVARLDPWTGLLYGFGYALSSDYAITYTAPARRVLAVAQRLWQAQDRERFYRLLGAWAADCALVKKSAAEIAREVHAGEREPLPANVGPSPFALPRVRTAAAALSFATPAAALDAALDDGLPLAAREYVADAAWTGARAFDGGARAALRRDDGDRLDVDVTAGRPALVVVATTWDRFWSARADDHAAPVLETAAGYLAIPVPAGCRRLEITYRDPWVRVGATTSAVTLLALAALALARRRAQRGGAEP